MAAFETSLRADHLVNVRLAEQRAHDAMMMARSMQADIRNNNARLQSFGQGVKTSCTPKSPIISASKPITSPVKHADALHDYFDLLKDQSIVAVPVAWITDVFSLNK
jgi:hypothetical protein